jgi:hypothetical protein
MVLYPFLVGLVQQCSSYLLVQEEMSVAILCGTPGRQFVMGQQPWPCWSAWTLIDWKHQHGEPVQTSEAANAKSVINTHWYPVTHLSREKAKRRRR